MKLKDNYHVFALITIIFWSLGYVFTRLALRYFIASISLIIFLLFIKIKIPNKNDIKWFILAGFFGFFFYMIVFNIGSTTVTAATASLIIATVPIITTLMARILFKEKLKAIQYIAIIIGFIGVSVLTLTNGIFSINSGILWLLLASMALSIYNLLQRKTTKKYSPLITSIFSIWFGTIFLFVFIPNSIAEIKIAPLMQIIYLTILGVFSGAIAYISWAYALSKCKYTSSVTNYMFVTPFLTAILGMVIAQETLDLSTIIGGSIIMLGMFIYNFYEKINLKINEKRKNST
jgi:drug/metabolite transporter (DMT)-like permease